MLQVRSYKKEQNSKQYGSNNFGQSLLWWRKGDKWENTYTLIGHFSSLYGMNILWLSICLFLEYESVFDSNLIWSISLWWGGWNKFTKVYTMMIDNFLFCQWLFIAETMKVKFSLFCLIIFVWVFIYIIWMGMRSTGVIVFLIWEWYSYLIYIHI